MRDTDQRLWMWGVGALALGLIFSPLASAGRLEGETGGCALGGVSSGCKWSPSDCAKPARPHVFAGDTASYNRAVDAYNSYLGAQNRYLQCISSDAKADITSTFPDMVNGTVSKLSDDVQEEVKRAKGDLDLARSQLHR
jgi:hypothetical protein